MVRRGYTKGKIIAVLREGEAGMSCSSLAADRISLEL